MPHRPTIPRLLQPGKCRCCCHVKCITEPSVASTSRQHSRIRARQPLLQSAGRQTDRISIADKSRNAQGRRRELTTRRKKGPVQFVTSVFSFIMKCLYRVIRSISVSRVVRSLTRQLHHSSMPVPSSFVNMKQKDGKIWRYYYYKCTSKSRRDAEARPGADLRGENRLRVHSILSATLA